MAPLLTLITYVVGAALAVGYACEAGLPFWRRATACALTLALAVGTGQLLMSANPAPAYAVGIPSLLLLGAIMIAPQRPARPATPRRRASDQVRSARTAKGWDLDRKASRHHATLPSLTDSDGPHYPDPVTQLTPVSRSIQVGRARAVTQVSHRTASDQRSEEAAPPMRRRHDRRGTPRSLTRISRCRYR
ncbi:hypothetical protein HC031_30250 [Planosporangium thailandense]|uniref:Uncharacterized protein n=1 Tax=Planosporangium thailandense TaxID=765197 RepID=A0ABX0Y6K5_9ACTN|nr:hypothetical protein [Planosporangium thailandense]NJC73963.1 hypothetical protein [Planosporangium thailandense]